MIETQPMNHQVGFKKILVVCSGSVDDRKALRRAAVLADEGGAEVEIFSVVGPQPGADFVSTLGGASQDRLDALRREDRSTAITEHLQETGLSADTSITVVTGKPFLEIVRHVMASECDLVVKAAVHFGALHQQIFGSEDLHLLRKCPVPVWIVRDAHVSDAGPIPQAMPEKPLVIAAVDFDLDADDDASAVSSEEALNQHIVGAALEIARVHGAGLTLIHAWEAPAEGLLQRAAPGISTDEVTAYVHSVERRHRAALDVLAGQVRSAGAAAGVPVSGILLRGDPDEIIPEHVNEAGPLALVMGTVGRSGIYGVIIGNTAEDILTAIDGSVLAVKPPDFHTPLHFED